MELGRILATAALLFVARCSAYGAPQAAFNILDPLNERIQTDGVIGSHFGAVDIMPATFDYVVVGGGTAGLAIAHRLSANYSVAVIEAGTFYELTNSNFTTIPAQGAYYLGKTPSLKNPLIDWLQYTTPQAGFGGVSALYPQGHTLGGSSARNFMFYQRGTFGAHDIWADMVGDDSYRFKNFNQYMQKSANVTPPNNQLRSSNSTPNFDPAAIGNPGGPLQVSWTTYPSPAASWLAKGLNAIGLKQLRGGMLDGNLFGWIWVPTTLDPQTQTRSSSETSYLRESLKETRPNLQVYTTTLAKKIIFDSNKKAVAVEVETAALGTGSVTWTINATKEVIVAAGTFRSPQILMTSGVGPSSTLKSLNIPVVADKPGVGQGMWDHVWTCVSYEVKTVTHSWLGNPEYAAKAAQQYKKDRSGILGSVGSDLLAFEHLPSGMISNSTRAALTKAYGNDWPELEIFALDAYSGTLNDILLGAPALRNYTSMCIAMVAPFSRGNVTIKSDDTVDHPVVNPNWLGDARDLEVAVAGLKRLRAIFAAADVKPVLVGAEAYPGANITTDEQIRQSIIHSSDTIHHAAGTCRMGRSSDKMAVIDSHGRVIGVKGLRVVDASSLPVLPPGHPQATIYGLAEKIAALIMQGG